MPEENAINLEEIKRLLMESTKGQQLPVQPVPSVLESRGRGARFALGFFNPPLAAKLMEQQDSANKFNLEAALQQGQQRAQRLGELSRILNEEAIRRQQDEQLALQGRTQDRADRGEIAEAERFAAQQSLREAANAREEAAAPVDRAFREAQTGALLSDREEQERIGESSASDFDSIEQSVTGMSDLSNSMAQSIRRIGKERGGHVKDMAEAQADELELRQRMLGIAINSQRQNRSNPDAVDRVRDMQKQWQDTIDDSKKFMETIGAAPEKEKQRQIPAGEAIDLGQKVIAPLRATRRLKRKLEQASALAGGEAQLPDFLRSPDNIELFADLGRLVESTRKEITGANFTTNEMKRVAPFTPGPGDWLVKGILAKVNSLDNELNGMFSSSVDALDATGFDTGGLRGMIDPEIPDGAELLGAKDGGFFYRLPNGEVIFSDGN